MNNFQAHQIYLQLQTYLSSFLSGLCTIDHYNINFKFGPMLKHSETTHRLLLLVLVTIDRNYVF